MYIHVYIYIYIYIYILYIYTYTCICIYVRVQYSHQVRLSSRWIRAKSVSLGGVLHVGRMCAGSCPLNIQSTIKVVPALDLGLHPGRLGAARGAWRGRRAFSYIACCVGTVRTEASFRRAHSGPAEGRARGRREPEKVAPPVALEADNCISYCSILYYIIFYIMIV